MSPSHRHQRLTTGAGALVTVGLLAQPLLLWGCNISQPSSPPGTVEVRNERPPPRPGESISRTVMCSCVMCEPESCCRELEQDAPQTDKECARGYDFSKCEMAVSSCDSRCFRHRWRTRVESGCDNTRPEKCCHDSASF
ncbi:MAG TPA: hypothetical protein ENK23_07895 [Sorangium sp.]|nr:hypothetical protein [Sorangium sp.]